MMPPDLRHFQELVRQMAGLTFDASREETLRRQVDEAMAQGGYPSRAALLAALRADRELFLEFINHLTVNETYFLREPQYLDLLITELVPELLTGKGPGEKVKILSAGCSTGEEPYSIAISLLDKFGPAAPHRFTIIGFDINSLALAQAEMGAYGRRSFRGGDETLRGRYFVHNHSGQFQLKAPVRELVRFHRFNLLQDDYPPLLRGADVIFYRNTSIYFDPPAQQRILLNLAAQLNEGGYVIFSASETFSHQDIGALTLVEKRGLFCFRKLPVAGAQAVSADPGERSVTSLPRRSQAEGSEKFAKKFTAGGGRTVSRPAESLQMVSLPESARSEDSERLFGEAVDCFRRKEHAQAAQLAGMIHSCKAYRAKAYLLNGCILLHGEKTREAEELFAKAVQCDGLELEAHLLLGLVAKNSGEVDKAISCFQKALYVENSCWMAHYFLAETNLARGNSRKARGYYDALRKILENQAEEPPRLTFFPISFKREDLLVLCRRKLASLSEVVNGL